VEVSSSGKPGSEIELVEFAAVVFDVLVAIGTDAEAAAVSAKMLEFVVTDDVRIVELSA
jgi:hypothetical protein